MVNKGYRGGGGRSGSKVSHAPNTACQQLPKPELRPSSFENQNHKLPSAFTAEGTGPGRPQLPQGQLERPPLPLRPVRPRAPAPRHTPAPSPRGHATRQASPTRARHKHTPSPEGPPGAAALPARRGSGSRPVRAGGPRPFVPSSSERDEGLGGERGRGDWRRN